VAGNGPTFPHKIRENKIGSTCSMYRGIRSIVHKTFWLENLKGDVDISWRIILKWILNK